MKNTVLELKNMQGAFLAPEICNPDAKLQNRALGLLIRYILMERDIIPK